MNNTLQPAIPPALVEVLRHARNLTVLTGAGISAESGLPTFREKLTGIWARYDPEDLATPQAFRRNPGLVWDWFAEFRQSIERAQPNPAHHALVALERQVPRLNLITQNIDGLHQRAGSRRVIELHGNIARNKCFLENRQVLAWEDTGETPPRCPYCGSYLRPDVVFFGELLPDEAIDQAMDATYQCDLFLSIGTSGLVEPAASLPGWAYSHGARVAIINLDVEPEVGSSLFKIRGKAGEVLPALVRAAWPEVAVPQPVVQPVVGGPVYDTADSDPRFTTFYE